METYVGRDFELDPVVCQMGIIKWETPWAYFHKVLSTREEKGR